MTEPQSTTGLPSSSDLSPADEESAEDTLSDQVARTDAALHAWRGESVKRRASWEAARVAAETQRLEQRRKAFRFGAATLVAALLTVFGVGALVHGLRTSGEEAPVARPPLSRIAVAEGVAIPAPAAPVAPIVPAPVATEPVATEPAMAPAATAPVATEPVATEPVATPPVVTEPVAAPAPVAAAAPAAAAPRTLRIEPGSIRVWNKEGHVWAAFATTQGGPVKFRWLDGARRPVLEPMGCVGPGSDGIRRCSAGRSLARLHREVESGATAGTWTVQACGSAGCTDLGTFPVR